MSWAPRDRQPDAERPDLRAQLLSAPGPQAAPNGLGIGAITRSPSDGWPHGNPGCPAWQSTAQTVCLCITAIWVNIRYCRDEGRPDHRLSGRTRYEDGTSERRDRGVVDARGVGPSGGCRSRSAIQSLGLPAPVPADLLPDVLDVEQGRDGADLGVLRAL